MKQGLHQRLWHGGGRTLHWLGRKGIVSTLRHPRIALAVLPRLLRQDWAGAAAVWLRFAQQQGAQQRGKGKKKSSATLWTEHGRLCFYRGELAAAEASLNKALHTRPDYYPALRLLALIAARQENWPLAAARWRNILDRLLTNHSPLEGESASVASRWGDNLSRAIEVEEAIQQLSLSLIEQGEFDEVDGLLEQLAAHPRSRRIALETQVIMAERRLDEAAANAARRALGPPTSSTAGCALVSLAPPRGGSDDRPEDLRGARDEQSVHLAMHGLEADMPRGEYLDLVRGAVARLPEAAGLHARYIRLLADSLTDDERLAELQARSRDFSSRFPQHLDGWRLAALAAIAGNDSDAVAALVARTAARLGEHVGLDRLRLWLAATAGEHEEARRLSHSIRSKSYVFDEDGRGLHLKLVSKAPDKNLNNAILLFACFRNERLFAPWFLDYYRGLGVERFFIVDNLSTDGTAEYLSRQGDVVLFSSSDHYIQTGSGIRWVNELMRRYGAGNWCVHVDADEQLVLPDGEVGGNGSGGALRGLVDEMAARGEEALPAFMLDTYPQGSGPDIAARLRELHSRHGGRAARSAAAGTGNGGKIIDPLSLSRLVDPDIYFTGKAACCFFRARGGARERLFGTTEILEKAPILWGGEGVGNKSGGERILYQNASHEISYARPSRRRGVLLHHKLLREMLEMTGLDAGPVATTDPNPGLISKHVDDRVDYRGVVCRARHARYRRFFQGGLLQQADGIPRCAATFAYESPAQLEALGLFAV